MSDPTHHASDDSDRPPADPRPGSTSTPSGSASAGPPSSTRRRVLAGAATAVSLPLAACVDGTLDTGGEADGEAPLVEDKETLELMITGDGVSPDRVRVTAEASVTVQVENESDQRHVVGSDDSTFPRIAVDSGTLDNALWEVPAEPGTVELVCRTHDQRLATAEVEPMNVSGGCPTG